MEHIKTILTAAGVPEEKANELIALPAEKQKDFKADEIVGMIRTGVETQVKNDPKFWEGLDENNIGEGLKKKFESAQYGRAAGIAKKNVQKALGLTDEDLADLTDEEKSKYEVMVTKMAEKFASGKASDKQMQKDLLEARKKIEEFETNAPEKEKAIEQKYATQYTDKMLEAIVGTEIGQSMVKFATDKDAKKEFAYPVDYIMYKVLPQLKAEYGFKIDGFNAKLVQKDKPELAVIEGSKELTLVDAIIKIADAQQLLRDKTTAKADNKKSGTIEGVNADVDAVDGNLMVSSHVKAKIDAAKKAAEK